MLHAAQRVYKCVCVCMVFKQNLLIFIVCLLSIVGRHRCRCRSQLKSQLLLRSRQQQKKLLMLPGPSFAALAAHRRFLRTPTNTQTQTHTHLHAYVYVCMYLQYVVLATGFWSIILVSSGLQSAADKEWTRGAGAGAERGQAVSGRHLLLPATSCSRLQLATVKAAAASANRKLYGAIAPKGSELVIFTFIAKLCIFFFV